CGPPGRSQETIPRLSFLKWNARRPQRPAPRGKEFPTDPACEFRPLPFLGNPHVQTLLGNLLRGPRLPQSAERLAALPDGDRLVLHDSMPPRWRPGDPIALLVHGLGGSHRSGYLHRVARLLLPHGLRVVRLDLRGAGRAPPY